MMEHFLADKTITLHDLANNGLLQLDQIQSYNTLSILSNHSSSDNYDEKKENEEYLLDEIDVTSRRSLNKTSDQHSISRRLTDTSISHKQTSSLRNLKPSKTPSNVYHRKSSLPTDTSHEIKDNKIPLARQRRRQTITDAKITATPSHFSNQASIKKSSKCKNI